LNYPESRRDVEIKTVNPNFFKGLPFGKSPILYGIKFYTIQKGKSNFTKKGKYLRKNWNLRILPR